MESSLNPKSVFVIIPTFNEGQVIRTTIAPLLEQGYTVVLVDDCSSDDTETIVADLPLTYIKHPINLGQGAALQTGFDYATQSGAEYVVTFDADGQHNYAEIPSLLAPVVAGEVDLTMGTRFKRKADRLAVPTSRRLLLRTAILVNGLLTGLWLTDAHNGFRALNRTAFSQIKLTENRMAHASEILSQIKKYRLRYEEIPVNIVYTDYSKMKGQRSSNAINIVIDLLLKKIF